MSTNGPGISAEGENSVGGVTTGATDRLKDVAPSRSDPHDDLVMPHLPTPAWGVLLDYKRDSDVLNALKAIMAWKDAGRLRRAHNLPLWPREKPADVVTLPSTFRLAEQSGADKTEIQDRINRLEQWAFELIDQSPELTRQVLDASNVELWADSRMAVLREVAKDAQARKDGLAANKLTGNLDAHTHAYLESRWAETKDLIDASARWGLYLAQYFVDQFQSLTQETRFDLTQPWWKPQNQGRTAGCVGHAVADLLRSQLNDKEILPSARYLWNGAKELDGESRPTTFVARAGTSLRAALHLVKAVGCAVESELPSESLELYDGSLDDFYRNVGGRRVSAVVNLGVDKKMWLSWLALGRPVVCAIRAKEEFVNPGPATPHLDHVDPDGSGLINHAVVVAGWRLARETFSEKPGYDLVAGANQADKKAATDTKTYFPVEYLVRNTVGEGWGQGGCAWVPHRLMRLMAREAYGVLLAEDEVTNPVAAAPEKRSWSFSTASADTARPARRS